MCYTRLAGNKRTQKWRKKSPSGHHLTTLSGYIFATKACIDNRRKLVKQHYLPMSLQYGELRSTTGWDRFVSLGHASKFQRVSRLAFVTVATSLTGGQPHFARCLAVSCAATLYIFFSGLLPLTEFCRVQNSLYIQVLRSLISAALLHGTPAAGVSQTLRRGTRNWIIMVTLCNGADHYIFILWFLLSSSSFFLFSPNLSGRRFDVYHTSTHGVALVSI